jgi:hypothetical protein
MRYITYTTDENAVEECNSPVYSEKSLFLPPMTTDHTGE